MKNLKKGDVVVTSKGNVGIVTIPKLFNILNNKNEIVYSEDFNLYKNIKNELKDKNYRINISEPLININGVEFEISENHLTKITKCYINENNKTKRFIFTFNKI